MKPPEAINWTTSVTGTSGCGFRWGHSGDEIVAEWAGILVLRASKGGELRELTPAPGASDDLVEKTRTGLATAFLRSHQGQHAFHASAVAWRGSTLLCIGNSGLGKSTVASCLCRHHEVELFADDTATIECNASGALSVTPSDTSVWLEDSLCGRKVPQRIVREGRTPSALTHIAVLAFDEAVGSLHIRPLHGVDALAALLPSLVRFETGNSVWVSELNLLETIVSQVQVVQVTRSRRVPADTVANRLLALLRGER